MLDKRKKMLYEKQINVLEEITTKYCTFIEFTYFKLDYISLNTNEQAGKYGCISYIA